MTVVAKALAIDLHAVCQMKADCSRVSVHPLALHCTLYKLPRFGHLDVFNGRILPQFVTVLVYPFEVLDDNVAILADLLWVAQEPSEACS